MKPSNRKENLIFNQKNNEYMYIDKNFKKMVALESLYAFVGVCTAGNAAWSSPTNENKLYPTAGDIPALNHVQQQRYEHRVPLFHKPTQRDIVRKQDSIH